MTTARRRTAGLLATAILSALVPALVAENASASFECRYDASTRVLSVADAVRGGEEKVIVRRVGTSIRVVRFFGPDIPCEGAPTVTTTDLIEISSSGFNAVEIQLERGPFAPGASPEADGSSEIEFTVAGNGIVVAQGRRGPDHFRFVTAGGVSGLNLNPGPGDSDVDIALPDPVRSESLFIVDGGRGRDTIDMVGRPRVQPLLDGGAGDDTLLTPGGIGGILDGGTGRDRIVGSPGLDLIAPGKGADRITASAGSDLIEAGPDRSRDRIDCGSGRDQILRPDRFDRLRSCERVTRKG